MSELPNIERADFDVVRQAVHRVAGISLSDAKKSLVQSRLAKRLRQLGMRDFADYAKLLDEDPGSEREVLIAALTTHTTHFWREAHHFDDFSRLVLLPRRHSTHRKLRVWSVASSTGEEPYSLAMTIARHLDLNRWDVKILATDIDVGVLHQAEQGIYEAEAAEAKPEYRPYFVEGRNENAGMVRVRKDIRSLVRFRRLNLVQPTWPVRAVFDAIFVRNVLIYFDAQTQLETVRRLASLLSPDGILVLGHAESMLGVKAGLRAVGRGIFESRRQ